MHNGRYRTHETDTEKATVSARLATASPQDLRVSAVSRSRCEQTLGNFLGGRASPLQRLQKA